MPTPHPIPLRTAVLRLIHRRAGNPRQQPRLTANAGILDQLAAAALEIAAEATRLAAELSAAADRCRKPACAHCGNPLPIRATGRERLYCDDDCGRAARRIRTGSTLDA